ncbi:MAG: pilus assembly protein [Candidatus Dormibacteraeota bacterium]|nr:pilus assembly protein [Candidatus Dormibacteraeota bacterium]
MKRRERSRAQAMVEMALIVPFLTLLTFGSADLGRAFYLHLEITGAARAGMRAGIQGGANDVGDAIRSEPNTAIPNTAAAWGSTGPGGSFDCNPGAPGHLCGDPNGCPASAFASGQIACYAVRSCTITASACSSYGAWQSRPPGGGTPPTALMVRVVYKFTPVTPLIADFGSGGSFYLAEESYGLELY